MKEFHSDKEIKSELDSPDYQEKIPAFAGKKYPIEYLSSREFEMLLYFLFKKDISSGENLDKYDFVLLTKGTAERGRDVILQKKKRNVGIIQCKRYADLIQKPQLVREVIKFVLHSIQDKSLIDNASLFTYYFVALSGFNDKALILLQDFNKNVINEPNLKLWTEQVLEENETLKFRSFDEVEKRLKEILSKITLEPINGIDIDQKLKNSKDILSIFFEVEKVASQDMLDEMFKKYVGFKNDEDLERLRKRLQDLPKENRMSLGFFSVFGYDENFYRNIANDRALIVEIADLKSKFNQKFIDYLKDTIEKYHLIFIAGHSDVSPFTKQAIVPYLFSKYALQFQKTELGKIFTEAIEEKANGTVNRLKTMGDVKQQLLEVGEMVLKNDFSTFVGEGDLLELKKDISYWTHKEFKSVEEMSYRFDKDMEVLQPIIETIEGYIQKIMPQNPTIIIENPNVLDSKESIEKLLEESKRFEKN